MNAHGFSRRGLLPAMALAIGVVCATGAEAGTAPAAGKSAKPVAAKKKSPPVDRPALEARAVELLKATGARLSAAQSMAFTATVSYEHPSRLGPPLVFSSRYDVFMQRPEKLKVVNLGDGPVSEFTVDGKAMVAYMPAEQLVAVAPAPPTLEAALKEAFEKAAIYFPFSDLLLPDPYAAIAKDAKLVFQVGQSSQVGGVKTDVVAFANDDVFIQMWIGSEDKLPRRMRAVYRADPLRLRHDMEITGWQLDPAIAADTFAQTRAQDARPIDFAHPAASFAVTPSRPQKPAGKQK